MARDYKAEIEQWSEIEAISRAAHKQWEKDVGKALKNGEAVPPKPDIAHRHRSRFACVQA